MYDDPEAKIADLQEIQSSERDVDGASVLVNYVTNEDAADDVIDATNAMLLAEGKSLFTGLADTDELGSLET